VIVPVRRSVLSGHPLAAYLVVIPCHRDGQATAWRDEARVPRVQLPGGMGFEEVQDCGEVEADRRGRVDDGPQVRIRQDAQGVTQVRGHGGHAAARGQQSAGVRQHLRVQVGVGDPALPGSS